MKKRNKLRLVLSIIAVLIIAAIIVAVGMHRKNSAAGPDKDTTSEESVQPSGNEISSEEDSAADSSSKESESENTESSNTETSGGESSEGSENAESEGPELIEDEGDIVITVPDEMSQGGL